ncbi:MAG: hypothetical protein A2V88_12340 [Elusimicrobia bacterium RBG_16_66_12]|nr:MAG: hypothetical protein A2V88_12340 [Elusimicrobia bacterium RBG_16_66_12]
MLLLPQVMPRVVGPVSATLTLRPGYFERMYSRSLTFENSEGPFLSAILPVTTGAPFSTPRPEKDSAK